MTGFQLTWLLLSTVAIVAGILTKSLLDRIMRRHQRAEMDFREALDESRKWMPTIPVPGPTGSDTVDAIPVLRIAGDRSQLLCGTYATGAFDAYFTMLAKTDGENGRWKVANTTWFIGVRSLAGCLAKLLGTNQDGALRTMTEFIKTNSEAFRYAEDSLDGNVTCGIHCRAYDASSGFCAINRIDVINGPRPNRCNWLLLTMMRNVETIDGMVAVR